MGVDGNTGFVRSAGGRAGHYLHDGNIIWLGAMHEAPCNPLDQACGQDRGKIRSGHGQDRATVLGIAMRQISHFLGFDICMRFQRLDWSAQQTSKLVDRLTERKP